MTDKPLFKHLRPEDARRIAGDIVAFALEFYEQGSGDPLPLQWIEDDPLVARFVEAIGLSRALPDEPTAFPENTCYLRAIEGAVYCIGLFDVSEKRSGITTLIGGHTRCEESLCAVICEAYSLERYDSELESRWMKMSS